MINMHFINIEEGYSPLHKSTMMKIHPVNPGMSIIQFYVSNYADES